MKELKNYTPHPVVFLDERNEVRFTVHTQNIRIRVPETVYDMGVIETEMGNISDKEKQFGELTELPQYNEDTILIVSRLVLAAARGRDDLRAPGGVIRDANGNILGCQWLER